MKNRFKTISGALALTFMLLFGAVAFAHTSNTSMANPNVSAAEMPSARNERRKIAVITATCAHGSPRKSRDATRDEKEPLSNALYGRAGRQRVLGQVVLRAKLTRSLRS